MYLGTQFLPLDVAKANEKTKCYVKRSMAWKSNVQHMKLAAEEKYGSDTHIFPIQAFLDFRCF